MIQILIEGHVLESFIEQVVADHMMCDVKTVTRSLTLRELGDLFEHVATARLINSNSLESIEHDVFFKSSIGPPFVESYLQAASHFHLCALDSSGKGALIRVLTQDQCAPSRV